MRRFSTPRQVRFARPVLLLTLLAIGAPAYAQEPVDAPQLTVDYIMQRANEAERMVIANVRDFRPIIEVYIQNSAPDDKAGVVPTQDTYFLGRFSWRERPRLETLSGGKDNPRVPEKAVKELGYLPDGFAATAAPDWDLLSPARYKFTFVRREFLGEARCFVVDVTPVPSLNDGFAGRLWIEDRGYNIVRFNGINRRIERSFFKKLVSFHIDSWRVNSLAGVWLPSYVYAEEVDLPDAPASLRNTRIRSQVRFWGYQPKNTQAQGQFTAIEIAEPEVRDNTDQGPQLSTVLSQRRWEQEAEANVIDRLDKAGLLAASGEVEKILDTVLTNLQVTNDISLHRPVQARVVLTSPLESLTIGHTIILSRGLIDVLPDEASLAMMLAHELAHIVLGHPLIDTQFAFSDRMLISDGDLLRTLKVHRPHQEETAADAKVLEMLQRSPYRDKLSEAGLFLRMIAARARQLPNLIQPHFGDRLADGAQNLRLAELVQQAPELKLEQLDQIAALPLGARLVLDPWSGRLQLLRTAAQLPGSLREKVPLAVTPLMPIIKYIDNAAPKVPQASTR